MSMRVICGIRMICGLAAVSSPSAQPLRPNIIVVFADDYGDGDPGERRNVAAVHPDVVADLVADRPPVIASENVRA